MKIQYLITAVMMTTMCRVQAKPVPGEIFAAVKEVAANNGLHPREPHYLLEQFVPKATGDEEQRKQMAWALMEAFASKNTTAAGRTVIAQHLARVAGDAEKEALRNFKTDAQMMADARIALNEVAVSSIKDEGKDVYLAEIETGNPDKMIAGLSALSMFHAADSASAAQRHIGHRDMQVSATALRILAKHDPSAFAESMPGLSDDGQLCALAIVMEEKIVAAFNVVLELAKSGNEDIRAAAVTALGVVGDSSCVEILIRAGAVDALTSLNADGVDKAVLDSVNKGDSASRMTALKAAGRRGIPDMDDVLLVAAASDDSEIAAEALKVLGRSGDTSNYPKMVALLGRSRNKEVETTVRRMIKRMEDRESCLKPLTQLMESSDVSVKISVLNCLSAMDTADALALVEKHLTVDNEKIFDAAVRALAQWTDPAVLPLLRKIVDNKNTDIIHRTLCQRSMDRFGVSDARLSALAYLNCGVDTHAKGKSGAEIAVLRGTPWKFTEEPAGMIVFDDSEVVIDVKGLDPKMKYQLGFVWWDYDNNGRAQSVVIGKMNVLDKTALPAWNGKNQLPQTIAVNIPVTEITPEGACLIRFSRAGQSNCVVSELWVSEGEIDGAPKPVPVAVTDFVEETKPLKPSPERFGPPVIEANKGAQKKVLVVTGLEYPGHPWQETAGEIVKLLAEDKRLEVSYTEDYTILSRKDIFGYDTVFLNYQNHNEPAPQGSLANLTKYVEGGGGLSLFHFACGAFIGYPGNAYNPEFVKIAGRVWNPELRGHDPYGRFMVTILDGHHPVTKGMKDFEQEDELYTCLEGDVPIHVLATAVSKVDKKVYPMAFTVTPGKGRTFHCVLGHNLNAFSDPMKELFRRGTAWAAGLENGEEG